MGRKHKALSVSVQDVSVVLCSPPCSSVDGTVPDERGGGLTQSRAAWRSARAMWEGTLQSRCAGRHVENF